MKDAKAAHPCSLCRKRKVKCDRNLPACGYCVERDEVHLCIYDNKRSPKRLRLDPDSNEFDDELYEFWYQYEKAWLRDTMGQCESYADTNTIQGFNRAISEDDSSEIYGILITRERAYKLLDFALQKLGWLFFGFFADVGEIPIEMEKFWDRYDLQTSSSAELVPQSVDEMLWDLTIRAILTMAIFYMPSEEFNDVFEDVIMSDILAKNVSDNTKNTTHHIRYTVYEVLLNSTLKRFLESLFSLQADIRTLQVFLILANTSFLRMYPSLGNSVLVHCIHLTKILNIKDFKLKINDTALVRLEKLVSQNIWFRMSLLDYLRSSPSKKICIHTENRSILHQRPDLTEDEDEMIDVYDFESTLEMLHWKLLSLERDLDSSSTLSLKTLNSTKDIIRTFEMKAQSLENKTSCNMQFQSFILRLQCNFALWKVKRREYTEYHVSNGMEKLSYQSEVIIGLLLENAKNSRNYFNSHWMCIHALSTIAAFHAFYDIFHNSQKNRQLSSDTKFLWTEICGNYYPGAVGFLADLTRLEDIASLWTNIKIIDEGDPLIHPVMYILQEDLEIYRKKANCKAYVLKLAATNDTSNKNRISLPQRNVQVNAEFRRIIDEFRVTHPLYVEST